jgi:hypothetical protein
LRHFPWSREGVIHQVFFEDSGFGPDCLQQVSNRIVTRKFAPVDLPALKKLRHLRHCPWCREAVKHQVFFEDSGFGPDCLQPVSNRIVNRKFAPVDLPAS